MVLLAPATLDVVRMTHLVTGAEKYARRSAYRGSWYGQGWRAPEDDPLFIGDPSLPNPTYVTDQWVESLLDDYVTEAVGVTVDTTQTLTGAKTFQAPTAATTPVMVKGAASQTAPLQDWQSSTGASVARLLAASGGAFLTAFLGELAQSGSYIGFNAAGAAGGAVLVGTRAPANVGLVVRGSASQTGDLTQWQNATPTVVAGVTSVGRAFFGRATSAGNATVIAEAISAANPVVVARGTASQTGDLTQWQDSTGAVLTRVSSAGDVQLSDGVGIGSITSGRAFLRANYDTGGIGIRTNADANKGLVVRAWSATQAADLQQWQNSAAGSIAGVSAAGRGYFGAAAPLGGAALTAAAVNVANPVAVVRGGASQTGNLSEWQDSAGAVVASVTPTGSAVVGPGGQIHDARLSVNASSATAIGAAVKGAAAQTANLAEYQDSTGGVAALVNPTGAIVAGGGVVLSARLSVYTASAGTSGVVIRQAASQTAQPFQVQDSAGAVVLATTPSGSMALGANTVLGRFSVLTGSAATAGVVVRGVASQSAELSAWQDSAGGQVARVSSFGSAYFANVGVGNGATLGGGSRVLAMENASIVPNVNPTGGGVLYAEAGALKWRGSAGTITQMAAA